MTTAVRNRVLRLASVRASELVPHPRNWRAHPEQQAAALRGILAEIGYADAPCDFGAADGPGVEPVGEARL